MRAVVRSLSIALFSFIVGLACDYAPSGVSCGELTCGDGEVCLLLQDSCLPVKYSCITEYDGCGVDEQKDADEFAACVDDPDCEFNPDSEVLSCSLAGDAGC